MAVAGFSGAALFKLFSQFFATAARTFKNAGAHKRFKNYVPENIYNFLIGMFLDCFGVGMKVQDAGAKSSP